jgi:hypothetical protein
MSEVPPLDAEGTWPAPTEPMVFDAGAGSGRRRWLPYAVLTAAVIVLLVVAAAVVVSVQRDRYGPRMASAAAMPPSTAAYMSLDFEDLGDFGRLIDAFDGIAADARLDAGADVLDLIDEMVLGEFGLSVADFEPWIGRDVGVAVFDLNLDEEGFQADPGAAVLAASVRDRTEADLFLPKLVRAMTDLGMEFEQDTYGDVAVWVSGSDPAGLGIPGSSVVLGRSDDLVLLASSERAMRVAIEAQHGESLRDAGSFERVVDELPGGRAVTLYLGPDLFEAVADLATNSDVAGIADAEQALENIAGAGASLSLADNGVRLDFVHVADEAGEAEGFAPQEGSQHIASALPADTFAFFGIGEWDVAGAFAQVDEALAEGGLDQQVTDIEQEFGIDIERDVVALLSGELGFGLFPEPDGPIAATGGPPVGGLVLLGLTDPDAFATTIERFNQLAAENELLIDEQQSEGGVVYGISPDGGDPVWYGISEGFFAAGTDRALAEPAGERLADTALWNETRAALDTEGAPLFYLDLDGALDAFEADPEIRHNLDPLRALTAAVVTGDGVTRVTLVAIIDY